MELNFEEAVTEHMLAIQNTIVTCKGIIKLIIDRIEDVLLGERKILIFGNGGSAADAQHVAAEFINRFEIERHPLPAIALTTDSSIITSIGNDYDFKHIFSKQIAGIGIPGDLAIGISTSGTSPNVIEAFKIAKEYGLNTILFTGNKPINGILVRDIDIIFRAQSQRTATIQEVHIFIWHLICKAIDYKFKDT